MVGGNKNHELGLSLNLRLESLSILDPNVMQKTTKLGLRVAVNTILSSERPCCVGLWVLGHEVTVASGQTDDSSPNAL